MSAPLKDGQEPRYSPPGTRPPILDEAEAAHTRRIDEQRLAEFDKLLEHGRIREVKEAMSKLLFGEMVDLVDEFWKQVDPAAGITRDNLPMLLWNFATGRTSNAQTPAQDRDPPSGGGAEGVDEQREDARPAQA